ncbi:cytochrome C oxidase subunit I [Halobacteriales archaeon QH_8_64_26]|nr:MAG: cytochrome C oxidase subunit I [Halobacteriales archaeon QH_8_64_26]
MIGGGILAGALAVLVLVCCTGLARAIGWPATTTAGSSRQPRGDGGYARRMEVYTGFDTHGKESGLLRWLTTVDHKDIGLLYIFFGAAAGLWGGTDGMMIRTELLTPPADVWTASTYNGIFTTHGWTMLIFFVTPVFFGIANYFLPILIDAEDMAFPRLNAIGFWLLPPSLLMVRGGLITEMLGKILGLVVPVQYIEFLFTLTPPELGWYIYTPLSVTATNPQVDIALLGLHLSGIATVMASINFIATVFVERGEETTWADLSIFTWSILVTAGIALFAFSLLGSVLVMLLLDRNFATTFFAVDGGSPLLFQNLFWFWGHPEVYIIFLPATGLLSTILPKFSGRKLFGYKYIVYSTLAIGVLSFGVWAHHMFTTGMDPRIRASFMAVSIAIAVPSAIKVFNWLTTMWEGRIRLTAPMLLCIGAIGNFVVGGITGVFLAAIPVDIVLSDTYYVVGHFHFIVAGFIAAMMMAASYYWYPILTGRMYDRDLARLQAVIFSIGSAITFGSLLIVGQLGLPRRYAAYPPEFAPLMQVASIGAYAMGIATLMWVFNMIQSYRVGAVVTDADVWDLKRSNQFSREWQWFENRLDSDYGIAPTAPPADEVHPSAAWQTTEGEPASPSAGEDFRSIARDAAVGVAGGTLAITLMSLVLAGATVLGFLRPPLLTGLARILGIERGTILGLPVSLVLGFTVFYAGGVIFWPTVFAAGAGRFPGGNRILVGLSFAMLLWPGFALGFYSGQTGFALVAYLGSTLFAHAVYGATLSASFEYLNDRYEIASVL